MTRPRRVAKCSERLTDSCDPVETDGCCSIIPCAYCLILRQYGEPDLVGEATFGGNQWSGTVDGHTYVAYWESVYGVCEFVVLFNGLEVSREPCYGPVTCKDSSGEAGVTIGYESYTLIWNKKEDRPLPHVTEDGCVKHWCGDCNCTCTQIRVCLTGRVHGGSIANGCEILTEYARDDCNGPQWTGTVDGHSVDISLEADAVTGDCILTGNVDGIEFDAEPVTDCKNIDASISLYGGGTLTISCATCGDNVEPPAEGCDLTDRPLYVTGDYTVTVPAQFVNGPNGVFIFWEHVFVNAPCEFDLYVKCENNPTPPAPSGNMDSSGSWVAIVGCHHSTGTDTVSIVSTEPFLATMTCDAAPGNPFGCDLPKEIVISE